MGVEARVAGDGRVISGMSTLSPGAQARYNTISEYTDKVQRVYGMVETFAATRHNSDSLLLPLSRAFAQLKLQFMGAGLDRLSQQCGAMEVTARRGLSPNAKIRILREGVGSLKSQLDLELRSIVSDDLAAQRRAEEAAKEEQV